VTLPPRINHLRSHLIPLGHEVPGDPAGPRQSWVLILLYPREGDVRFVLTRRTATLSRHAGQISLPGGVHDVEDGSLWATAVREAGEEIGLRPGRLVPLGRLEEHHLRVSRYLIHPFVAWNPVAPRFAIHEREVDQIIEVRFDALFDQNNVCEETWELRGEPWLVTFYKFEDQIVWGATARILSNLASCLQPNTGNADPPGSVRRP
jgi:8-oxo-dGTP pyrophosphatase MutT (NUDIX family)